MITSTNLVKDIFSGALDASLDDISETIRQRREAIKNKEARKLRAELDVGDTVYFVDTCRPTYLAGAAAIVRKFNPKKIVVDLVTPAGRFNKGIICPPTLLTTVKP